MNPIPEHAIPIDVSIIEESEKDGIVTSFRIESPDVPESPAWIPKTVIVDDPDGDETTAFSYKEGYTGRLLVQKWFAESRGWM